MVGLMGIESVTKISNYPLMLAKVGTDLAL